MKEKSWFVYLVRCADNTLYCGSTVDINRRLEEHNFKKRGAKYTRSRRPVSLVGYVKTDCRSSAQKIESKIKKMKRGDKLKFFLPDS